jgi:hypothetical protein
VADLSTDSSEHRVTPPQRQSGWLIKIGLALLLLWLVGVLAPVDIGTPVHVLLLVGLMLLLFGALKARDAAMNQGRDRH